MSAKPSIFADRVGRSGGVWDYVSPSRVNLWIRCPLAFRLRYVDGLSTPATPSQFVGKMVHRALERYYRHRQQAVTLPIPEVTEKLLVQWSDSVAQDQVQFSTVAAETAARQQTVALVSAYLRQIPADEPRPLSIELPLEAPLVDPVSGDHLGIPLVGILDLVLPGAEGAVVTDFKTTSRGGDNSEISHELQLTSYAFLFRQHSSLPEEALEIRSLIKTKQPRVEYHRFARRTQAHFQRLFAIIRAYLDALDSGNYFIRPNHLCAACEFSHSHCREWTG